MTKFNDLYKEIIVESDISNYISALSYKLKYKDYLPIIQKYNLVYNEETKRFDCDNGINCKDDLVENGKLIIPFGVIDGYFNCSWKQLTSLEHCPEIVNGYFNCCSNKLTSLKYCPKIVNGSFNCSWNLLTSLEHCPKIVNGDFNCSANQLTSLKHCPIEVHGDFKCQLNIITDFSINCKIKGKFSHD